MKKKEMLIEWLNDAYAMEQSITKVLEKQSAELDEYPDLQAKINDHLEETKSQADRVENCLDKLGEEVSGFKSGMAKMFGSIESVSIGKGHDRAVKYSMSDLTTEHFEIAAYRTIIAAAKDLGESEIVMTCEGILEEEKAMAQWIDERLESTVDKVLAEEHE